MASDCEFCPAGGGSATTGCSTCNAQLCLDHWCKLWNWWEWVGGPQGAIARDFGECPDCLARRHVRECDRAWVPVPLTREDTDA